MEERAGLHGAWMGAHNVGGAWIPRTTLGMEAIQVRERAADPNGSRRAVFLRNILMGEGREDQDEDASMREREDAPQALLVHG